MTATIALLRSINVGGRKVVMAELRALAVELGFADARTLLASGNLVFTVGGRSAAEIEALLEDAVATRLGVRTDVMARTAQDWRAVIAGNPFPEEAERDPAHLVVVALKAAPTPAAIESLRGAISGREVVRVQGREAYIIYPDGIGESRLTNVVIDRKLDVPGTGRNWNTVLKLAELAGA